MKSQKSTIHDQTGCLYLVGTPIGNLEDISVRALRILKEADIIAAEDTRNTKKLCNYFEIDTPLMSYHEHNLAVGGEKLLTFLQEGKTIALVSDAGLPCISDPGADIVEKAIAQNFPVVPIPGPNAAITALIASGLTPQPFFFYGFLNRGKKDRRQQLEQLKKRQETILLYEAPHRLKETLKDMEAILGNRRIVLARELTKKFEEFLRGTLAEAIEWSQTEEIRGEFCIVLEGNQEVEVEDSEKAYWHTLSIIEHVDYILQQNDVSSKEAIKEVAKERQLAKRDVYNEYHNQ
ncbi:16S rRNA (cytidine(1402)-2'-O)-methyltransferase [Lysinibacillus sp. FSL M8-0216]|uniref:Ribosomal RNA small subunit methyltransferase I n=1 Tax=Lysinibacillus fusiformis TaxID=28031 RepID=A0A1H9S4S6_9BACI|nr:MULTISPECIES: 16S rRNA (cytidine(1402)-2'-O)-methyltransferase [Lysinibacillus]HAU33030.1 16S rRNA (cytidine(1402)-2'-O)-methyltransferase [Lysinibacillus sp.]MCG7437424.1 16S rRNA (cytidine(1402)-2'-O)-methyltransferase [Lysinibacillus fusiformis]MED4672310.1 16S rRNA (cytidine(1402)-2'-O)-methyltransferase [Lysinibacillus fusiformis]QAS58128.1 16S rRNA (cytidine(1402)-2'-O)-methyltransferase [Lysinibacillus sphaericus]RDV26315.1 16S rRNA (cytidine(1402)-2'-O)-methyltransferase [Lysinibaci